MVVIYRGEKYKVLKEMKKIFDGKISLYYKLKHEKYDLWVNSQYCTVI